MTGPQRGRLVGRLATVLGSRHWFWVLPLVGVGLLAPGLGSGWIADDHVHRAALTADPELPLQHRSPARLFAFVDGDPAEVWRLIDAGILPWWSDPELRLAFYRPLAGLTHAVDYRLWPDSPFWAHLHSVFWYVCLIVSLLALYRRILPTPAVAGLAALLYTIDDSLTFPVLWIANRNAVISVFFGVVTLLVYDRWRRGGWRPGAVLAPLTLLGAVLANEGGVALGGYLVAYALFLDPAPPRRRIVALLRSAGVGTLWFAAHTVAGFGAYGSAMYVDPGAEPFRFLGVLMERGPILLWGQWAWPPADLYFLLSAGGQRALWWMAIALSVFLFVALLSILRRHAQARFLALGMVMALVPAATTFPSGRLLLFAGVGAAGLLALLLAHLLTIVRDRAAHALPGRAAAAAVLGVLAVVHVAVPLLSVVPLLGTLVRVERDVRSMAASMPTDAAVEDQDVIIVSTLSSLMSAVADVIQAETDVPLPRRSLVLWSGIHGTRVRRTDDHTLVVSPRCGYLCPPTADPDGQEARLVDIRRGALVADRLFRDVETRPFTLGERLELTGLAVEILRVEDGRPADVAFRFDEPLESPRWRWLTWQRGSYRPFEPPPIGDSVWLPFSRGDGPSGP